MGLGRRPVGEHPGEEGRKTGGDVQGAALDALFDGRFIGELAQALADGGCGLLPESGEKYGGGGAATGQDGVQMRAKLQAARIQA